MASKRIQGITIEIGGDTTKLQTALKGVDRELSKTQGALKDINKLLKLDPGNTELLTQKQRNLQSSIQATEERLKTLKSTQTDALSPEEYDALQREIIDTEQRLESLEDEYKAFGSVAQQKIAAVGQAMQEVGNKVSAVGQRMQEIGNVVPNKLKEIGSAINEHVLQPMIQVTKVVSAAGIAATTALTKGAVDAAAEYEQLVGGVETLFKDSSKRVIKNAQNAYKTSGRSANEYMKTVTAFSASLLNSLGGNTDKAARLADMAIQDMSDNANKFGADFSSIEAAYRGFAKEQYTLLDNLSLGYAGTKAGMEQLIRDAEKLDTTFKVTHNTVKKGKTVNDELAYSYGDIIKAIHIVQENMGVTGTTAAEASKTIEGSMAAAKAAWSNLLTAIGTGDDVKGATKTMLDAAGTYLADNLFPTIKTSLSGLTQLWDYIIDRLIFNLPVIVETVIKWVKKIPAWINDHIIVYIPWLMSSIYISVTKTLWEISESIAKWLGDGSTVSEIYTGLITTVDNIITAVKKVGAALATLWSGTLEPYVKGLVKTFITVTLPKASEIIATIADKIAGLIEWFNNLDPRVKKVIFDTLEFVVMGSLAVSGIGKVIEVGGKLISGIGTLISFLSGPGGVVAAIGLAIYAGYMIVKNWDEIKAAALKVGKIIADKVEKWINAAKKWFDDLNAKIEQKIAEIKKWFEDLVTDFKTKVGEIKDKIAEKWEEIKQSLSEKWEAIKQKWNEVIDALKFKWDTMWTLAKETWESFKSKVTTGWANIQGKVTETINNIKKGWNDFKDKLVEGWNYIAKQASSIWENISRPIVNALHNIRDAFTSLIRKIKTAITKINEFFRANQKTKDTNPDLALTEFDGGYRNALGEDVYTGVKWNAGAYDKPLIFTKPTVIQTPRGLQGFGDGAGAEVVLSYSKLKELVGSGAGDTNVNITINAQPGQSAEQIAAAVKRVFVREMQQREAAYA